VPFSTLSFAETVELIVSWMEDTKPRQVVTANPEMVMFCSDDKHPHELVKGHINELVVTDMETVREYVNQALSIRAKEHIKIRQPLASVTIPTFSEFVDFVDILTEELNVKEVVRGDELSLDLNITPELKREGIVREVIRYIQNARKQAGLNVDDRIKLSLNTGDDNLQAAIGEYYELIASETLAKIEAGEYSYSESVKIDGVELIISLQKS